MKIDGTSREEKGKVINEGTGEARTKKQNNKQTKKLVDRSDVVKKGHESPREIRPSPKTPSPRPKLVETGSLQR